MKIKLFGEGKLFRRAFSATKHEMFVSVRILVILSVLFSILLWFAEWNHPDYSIGDALLWPFIKYIDDPAEVGVEPPITVLGKIVGSLVGVLGIAIFAVPAGLIGSGLIDAMGEEKREKELLECRERMRKSFKRMVNVSFREYLNGLPDGHPDKNRKFLFVPDMRPVTHYHVRNGMSLEDIMDTIKKFPEFRLANTAKAQNRDERREDRIVVTHYPINRSYGFFIDRDSKITIVSTSSSIEVGTGWFAFYLAKLGGFNFISKEIEPDPDEIDSYYNLSSKPKVNGMTRDELAVDAKANKKLLEIMEIKEKNRADFMADLKSLCRGEDSWLIFNFTMLMNSTSNTASFHFAHSAADGSNSTINPDQMTIYNKMIEKFERAMNEEFKLSVSQKMRYPLPKTFIGYRLKDKGCSFNSFVLRTGGPVIIEDSRKHIILYRMAKILGEAFDPDHTISEDELKDFNTLAFGFSEQNVENTQVRSTWTLEDD
ncbi:MAG: hypothetical protein IKW83_11430 [Muribaculaceae bacterium]|nr:hypothetical protein [Muribaculaceae bacterium]